MNEINLMRLYYLDHGPNVVEYDSGLNKIKCSKELKMLQYELSCGWLINYICNMQLHPVIAALSYQKWVLEQYDDFWLICCENADKETIYLIDILVPIATYTSIALEFQNDLLTVPHSNPKMVEKSI